MSAAAGAIKKEEEKTQKQQISTVFFWEREIDR